MALARKTYPMQAYKIMHGLWGMAQIMFTKYIIAHPDRRVTFRIRLHQELFHRLRRELTHLESSVWLLAALDTPCRWRSMKLMVRRRISREVSS